MCEFGVSELLFELVVLMGLSKCTVGRGTMIATRKFPFFMVLNKNKNNQCRLNWPSGRTGSSMNWHLSHPIFNETTYVGNLVSLNYLIQPETFGVNHPTQASLCSLGWVYNFVSLFKLRNVKWHINCNFLKIIIKRTRFLFFIFLFKLVWRKTFQTYISFYCAWFWKINYWTACFLCS